MAVDGHLGYELLTKFGLLLARGPGAPVISVIAAFV